MRQDRKLVLAMIVVWGLAGLIEPHLPDAGQPLNACRITQALTVASLALAWRKPRARGNAICLAAAARLRLGVLLQIGVPDSPFRAVGLAGGSKLAALGL